MKPIKSKFLFYLLSLTWGLPLTLVGLVVSLVLIIAGYKPIKYGYGWYFEVGEDWGGFEMGLCFLTCKDPGNYLRFHEYGHGMQNCYFGLITPFLITIPSAIRYWYREFKYSRKHIAPKTGYYDIWFEKQASDVGKEAMTAFTAEK